MPDSEPVGYVPEIQTPVGSDQQGVEQHFELTLDRHNQSTDSVLGYGMDVDAASLLLPCGFSGSTEKERVILEPGITWFAHHLRPVATHTANTVLWHDVWHSWEINQRDVL